MTDNWVVLAVVMSLFGVITVATVCFSIWPGSWLNKQNSNGPRNPNEPEVFRVIYGFRVIVVGFTLVLAVTVLVLNRTVDQNLGNAIAIISSVSGVVGTLTAAFFGVQAAGAGQAQALNALQQQQSRLTVFPNSVSVSKDDKEQFQATHEHYFGEISAQSSHPDIATVIPPLKPKGPGPLVFTIFGKSPGLATITVSNDSGQRETVGVTVTDAKSAKSS